MLPAKQTQHPVVLPGTVGLSLHGSERRCCVRQDAKKALKPLPVPQGTLSCEGILYIVLYSCTLLLEMRGIDGPWV